MPDPQEALKNRNKKRSLSTALKAEFFPGNR
jgi:hypothetical protein